MNSILVVVMAGILDAVHYDPCKVNEGVTNLESLSGDTRIAVGYADEYLDSVGRRDGGVLFSSLISQHPTSVGNLEGLLLGAGTLLTNAATHLTDTADAYAGNEGRNVEQIVAALWAALDEPPGTPPVARDPSGGAAVGPLPSTVLQPPTSDVGHWIFDVLAWPDYLSIASWARRILGFAWELATGEDVWAWLWEWLGGEWEAIGLASSAWDNLKAYFQELPEELVARMRVMFEGWYDSEAATVAGGYFAEAARVLALVADPLASLATQYHDVAWSSFFLCQAVYSAIDALIDTIIAMVAGGMTFAEALAAPFTAGATAVTGLLTGIFAIVQAVSATWGYMMLAVNLIAGLAAALGAYLEQVTWVTLPEG